jgi:hypothetical protein
MLLDEPENYVDFLCKNKLKPNQFLLLYLLYTEKMVKQGLSLKFTKGGLIYKWSNEGAGWTKDEIRDLVSKEYVISLSEDYAFDQLILTSKFVDLMFINGGEAFSEILELYPDTFKIQGNAQPIFTKTVDLDEMEKLYVKAIKNSSSKHAEVKEILAYAAEKRLLNMKIDKFIAGKVWESIKKMKQSEGEGYGKALY